MSFQSYLLDGKKGYILPMINKNKKIKTHNTSIDILTVRNWVTRATLHEIEADVHCWSNEKIIKETPFGGTHSWELGHAQGPHSNILLTGGPRDFLGLNFWAKGIFLSHEKTKPGSFLGIVLFISSNQQ